VILNKKKASSHGMLERLGFFRYGPNSVFSINYQRLSYYLNKGVELKKSVKRFIH
jgi:ribosomal protein S16